MAKRIEGHIEKATLLRWVRHYAVLRGPVLHLYSKPEDEFAGLTLKLTPSTTVAISSKGNAIKIMEKKSQRLKFKPALDMLRGWMEALKAACMESHQSRPFSRPVLPPPTTSTQESDGSSEEIVVAEGGEAGVVGGSTTKTDVRVRRSLVKWWEGWKDVAEEFVVDNKFERFKILGKGAYGVVAAAVDSETGQKVAIKKCFNLFANLDDAKRVAREIRILTHVSHQNIISFIDLQPPLKPRFTEVYLVSELMDCDLFNVLYRKASPVELTGDRIRHLSYQLLCGLNYLHTSGVIHRDLKPHNILCNRALTQLKICDFGLSKPYYSLEGNDSNDDEEGMEEEGGDVMPTIPDKMMAMSPVVVTQSYRAPEVFLTDGDYTQMIDMWSYGCIVGEMYRRYPIFVIPGPKEMDLSSLVPLVTRVTGTPSAESLHYVKNPRIKRLVLSTNAHRPNYTTLFPCAPHEAIEMIHRCLHFDFNHRITVQEALMHPLFANVRDLKKEITGVPGVDIHDIEASKTDDALRLAMFRDFIDRHPEAEEDKKRLEEDVMMRRARGSSGVTTSTKANPAPGS